MSCALRYRGCLATAILAKGKSGCYTCGKNQKEGYPWRKIGKRQRKIRIKTGD